MASLDSIINRPIEGKKVFDSGSYGIIYDNLDGTLTKVIRFNTVDPYSIIKIKELELDNFYKVFDILTLNNGKKEYLRAYKMNNIKRDNTKLLNSNIYYFINNIKIIMNSLKKLSDNYIISYDLHNRNLIINDDGMTVIDCDLYKHDTSYSCEAIYRHNIDILKRTIYEELHEEMKKDILLSLFKNHKLIELFKENDLDNILDLVSGSNSIREYIKK